MAGVSRFFYVPAVPVLAFNSLAAVNDGNMPNPVNISWVWRTPQAAVVLKPAGLPTQAPQAYSSLESMLRLQLPDPDSYLAIPHRLDRPVAGLILVAFTKRAARLLSEQFESRRIDKTYVALVEGSYPREVDCWSDTLCKLKDRAEVRLLQDQQTPTVTLPPLSVDPNHRDAAELEVGKPAVTQVQRLAFFETDRTLLELKPETGRMHQLRVQTASRGYPIVGDQTYGSRTQLGIAHTNQIALFASGLQFFDPANGKRIEVKAELPNWCK